MDESHTHTLFFSNGQMPGLGAIGGSRSSSRAGSRPATPTTCEPDALHRHLPTQRPRTPNVTSSEADSSSHRDSLDSIPEREAVKASTATGPVWQLGRSNLDEYIAA